jgi:hypothetical protein
VSTGADKDGETGRTITTSSFFWDFFFGAVRGKNDFSPQ